MTAGAYVLPLILGLPLLGAILVMLIPKEEEELCRGFGLAFAVASFVAFVGGWPLYRRRVFTPDEEAMVPMRDGVRLHTRIWRPAGAERAPVILERGYWSGLEDHAEAFTRAGYAYVGQATRGHGQSEGPEGEGRRFFDDARDGYDTLDWLARQSWCSGDIAMYGKSYMAITQLLVAPEGHPNLKAIIPQNAPRDLWGRGYWCAGALTLAMTATGRVFDAAKAYDWDAVLRFLPLIDLDVHVAGERRKLWQDYVAHSTYDDFWKAISVRDKLDRIGIPVYLMGGWYDYYAGEALDCYRELAKAAPGVERRVVVSATDHLNRLVGDRSLPGGGKDELALAVMWLDHVLKRADAGMAEEPPVQIFVMGTNKWRGEREWPLARTVFTPYYLHGNGTLATAPPSEGPPSSYVYDPADPVPTLGGNHSCLLAIPNIAAGSVDQRPNADRSDVLVFDSAMLDDDLEVTGPVTVKLFAASSAPDTDFVAMLIDVHPDGTAYNLSEGIIRARFRRSIWEEPQLLEPGAVYDYAIELAPTANVFLRGHRIRVHITSSNFPLWDRNPNTGHPQGLDTEMQRARQTIFHDSERPSHILLPIIASAS